MSRDQILANLRTSLASSRSWLEKEASAAPHAAPPFVHPPAADLVAQFSAELAKLEGRTYPVADAEEALEAIVRLLDEREARQVIAWDLEQIDLPGLPAMLAARGVSVLDARVHGAARKERLQTLEPVSVCLSGVDCAIAESGTLVLRHGPGRPRLASLLAPCHIAVAQRSQLVRGLGEALTFLRERYGAALFDATSHLTFITGPSRTADIEMTLSLGIHGPPEVHVVVL
ncbi:MAG: lactate utilization protein [Chloroflexaceae bacterium]